MIPTCKIDRCVNPRVKKGRNAYRSLCGFHMRERELALGHRRPHCIEPGCPNLAKSNGQGKFHKRCNLHHMIKYKMSHFSRGREVRYEVMDVSLQPCSRCGWHESFCDRHRLKPGSAGGQYVVGNVI